MSGVALLLNTSTIGSANYKVTASITATSAMWAGTLGIGIEARYVDESNFYLAWCDGGDDTIKLYRGGYTQIGIYSVSGSIPTDPFTLALKCDGTTISVELNSTTIISVTDSTHSAEGDFGIRTFDADLFPSNQVHYLYVDKLLPSLIASATGVSTASGTVSIGVGTHTFTDTFDRADSDTVGGNWSESIGDWDIVSNGVRSLASAADSYLTNSTTLGSADYRVSANITSGSMWGFSRGLGIVGRYVDTSNFYLGWLDGVDTTVKLYRVSSGTYTQIGIYTFSGVPPADPFRLTLGLLGTTISVDINGVNRISVTDSTFSAEGDFGLRSFAASGFTNHLVNSLFVDGAAAGALTGSAAGVGGSSATIGRLRALSAASAGVAADSATIGRRRALIAASAGVAASSATVGRTRALVAASSGVATSGATIGRTRALSAASAGAASVSVAITRKLALSAAAAGVASQTATLGARRSLTATTTGSAVTSATIQRKLALSALASGVALATGAISKRTPSFTASASGVALAIATLGAYRTLTATAVASATTSAVASANRALSAAATGGASATAVVTARRSITATALGVALSNATPTRQRVLTATAQGAAVASGALNARHALLALVTGTATTTAQIGVTHNLTATAAGRATTAASATRGRLTATVDADISVDGWTNQLGAAASYAELDEAVPDDATYVQSPIISTGVSDPLVMGIQDLTDPGVSYSLKLALRVRAPGGPALRVEVLDASGVLVATRQFTPASAFTTMELSLNETETTAYRAGAGFSAGGQLRLRAVVP